MYRVWWIPIDILYEDITDDNEFAWIKTVGETIQSFAQLLLVVTFLVFTFQFYRHFNNSHPQQQQQQNTPTTHHHNNNNVEEFLVSSDDEQ